MSPNNLCRDNIQQLKVQIVDNQIWEPYNADGSGGPAEFGGTGGGGAASGSVAVAANTATAGTITSTTTAPTTAVSGTPSGTTTGDSQDKCPSKGTYQCANGGLQICNSVGAPTPYLGKYYPWSLAVLLSDIQTGSLRSLLALTRAIPAVQRVSETSQSLHGAFGSATSQYIPKYMHAISSVRLHAISRVPDVMPMIGDWASPVSGSFVQTLHPVYQRLLQQSALQTAS